MSANEVANTGGGWDIAIKEDDGSLAALGSSAFLPRLQHVGKMSKYSSAADIPMAKTIPNNNFALIVNDDDYKDVGKTVDVMAISWRQKALDAKAGKSYYDHTSDEFIEIETRAGAERNSKCMFGPEFLVYIPELGELATFFFGSKSLRFEVKKILALYEAKQPITFTYKTITLKDETVYTCATVTPCATPIDPPDADKMVYINKELEKFNNPKSSQTDSEPKSQESQAASGRAR